jgi:hypothetical protein
VLRVTVSEAGQPPLPAVDLGEPRVAIGSGADARIRLPAAVAREAHVELTPEGWRALAEVIVDGAARASGASGPVAGGLVFEPGQSTRAITKGENAEAKDLEQQISVK